ncbi:MAG: phospholipase D-like domain-containing protein [candidate division WOR-3 bacterium]|jgi:phosphatidylserine/phosphatidylglycerophosphate/cardiolipin synthase-like enzyme
MKKVKTEFIFVFFLVFVFTGCQPAAVDHEQDQNTDSLNMVPTKAKIVCNRDYFPLIYSLFENSKKSIFCVMYNINSYDYENEVTRLLDKLIVAHEKGVVVKVLLEQSDWNNDVTNSNHEVGDYLKSYGIDVRYDPLTVTTHCKLFIIDSLYVMVGSTNWTISAVNSNNEANALLEGEEIALDFIGYFENLWKNSFEGR